MFVIDPDPYLVPSYRISPFKTEYVALNASLADNDFAAEYFNKRFGVGNWNYTFNGREAIQFALQSYALKATDLVTILTTSQNFYISSCVTKEIEAICQWNRAITAETKVLLVNHEFGYPYPEMEQLKALGLPIIEDCCTTFFSENATDNLGQQGDFSVYSFPKFFPIQIGGLLVSNQKNKSFHHSKLTTDQTDYIQNVVSHALLNTTDLLQKRNTTFDYACDLFEKLGFSLRFPTGKKVVPSALLLNNHGIVHDLNHLKLYLEKQGIQNSVFYGEDAFFIPCHQNLKQEDVHYMFECIQLYLQKQQKT